MTDGVKGSNFTLGLISRIATVCPGINYYGHIFQEHHYLGLTPSPSLDGHPGTSQHILWQSWTFVE